MEACAKPGVFPGQLDRFVKARFAGHQAGSGQNAFAMGTDNGGIDGRREAEIIGIDDETSEIHLIMDWVHLAAPEFASHP